MRGKVAFGGQFVPGSTEDRTGPMPNAGQQRWAADRPLCFVVEDDPAIRKIIGRALNERCVPFREFGSERELGAGLRQDRPALIFIDLKLHDSDAVAAVELLKSASYGGQLQIVSGLPSDTVMAVQTIFEHHGFSLLPPLAKPFRRRSIDQVLISAGLVESIPHSSNRSAEQKSADYLQRAARRPFGGQAAEFYYQPKIGLRLDAVIGADMLVGRGTEQRRESLTPDFEPADDRTADGLAEQAIHNALADWSAFYAAGRNLQISISVPPLSLTRLPLARIVRAAAPQHAAWPGLTIQVDHGDSAATDSALHDLAAQMRIYGVRISTGRARGALAAGSSAPALQVSEVRIDRRMVSGCASDRGKRRICAALIELAHSLDAPANAEGVDDMADLDALIQLNCDTGQGEIFGNALSRDELIRALHERSTWTGRVAAPAQGVEPDQGGSAPRPRNADLTLREKDVMDHIVRGLSSKETARVLGLSPRTVEMHRSRLLSKTGARNIAELVRLSCDPKVGASPLF